MDKTFDLCIIGAGAAGLMAAITASRLGLNVALFEKNTAAGRKLLITGGGRCNVTHQMPPRDFAEACKPYNRFLRHCLYEFSPEDMLGFLSELDIETFTEPDGCVFPRSQKASQIRDALTAQANLHGVKFFYDKTVDDISVNKDMFRIGHKGGTVLSRKSLIACGGMSYPKTGCTGEGYELARKLGHTIKAPQSCLVPLVTGEYWPGRLAGTAIDKVALLVCGEKKKQQICGPLVFTDDGIGGPAVLNFSRKILPALSETGKVDILIDLLPDIPQEGLISKLDQICNDNPKKELPFVFSGMLSRSVITQLCRLTDIDTSLKAASLSKKNRIRLVSVIKSLPLTVVSTKPIEQATVTRGGVCIEEIDPVSMESKKCPGLYFAGEVMDVDGPCGGFNLQIAFSTAVAAAKSAAIDR